MEIPIDRPLIDGRNIREAATQTITGNDVIVHNNRPAVHLTINNAGDNTCTVTDVISAGQKLTLLIVALTAGQIIIVDGGSETLHGRWYRPYVGMYIDLEWDGAAWVEEDRGDSYEVTAAHGATGQLASCEGYDNVASGQYSHAEGETTTASAQDAHAEGRSNTASGSYSHAEGYTTTASNTSAHVEGRNTVASGQYSHAEGRNTTASGLYSHAEGSYASAALYGEHARASGLFGAQGDAQFSRVIARIATANAVLTETYLDGIDDLLTILDEYTYACKVMVVGRQDTGADNFMGTYSVLIERTGGVEALVGAVDIFENNPGGWGAGGAFGFRGFTAARQRYI